MFEVAKWEEDVPKSHENIFRKSNNYNKNTCKLVTVEKHGTKTSRKINPSANSFQNNRVDAIINDSNHKKKIKRKLSKPDLEEQDFDTDNLDELLLNTKKVKYSEALRNDDKEDLLFGEAQPMTKRTSKYYKKQKLKKMLEKASSLNHRKSIQTSGNKLRERMLERLKAAKFRYLNEKLCTSSGSDAQQLFQSDPEAFQTYHQGFQQQVKKWPINPLDVIIKKILKLPKSYVIADMGCGEATLAKKVPHSVRSFDLVATAPGVQACDMASTPLLAASVDVAVYCLALMGTQLTQYLVEANRILKKGGHLLIAEVESRFSDVNAFVRDIQRLGFKLKDLDKTHDVFLFFNFIKVQPAPNKKSKLPNLTLKPCLYKKR